MIVRAVPLELSTAIPPMIRFSVLEPLKGTTSAEILLEVNWLPEVEWVEHEAILFLSRTGEPYGWHVVLLYSTWLPSTGPTTGEYLLARPHRDVTVTLDNVKDAIARVGR